MKRLMVISCVDLLEYRFFDAQTPLALLVFLLTPKKSEEFALLVLSTLNF